MPRAILYPEAMPVRSPRATLTVKDADGEAVVDGYRGKLAKYVPAETVALLSGLSLATDSTVWRLVVVIVALGGTLVYLANEGARPWFFYPLATASLLAWIAGTTDLATNLVGLAPKDGQLMLTLTVFIVPGVDELLCRVTTQRTAQQVAPATVEQPSQQAPVAAPAPAG